MTNLLGTITDSAGNPIAGTLTVSLPATSSTDQTVPDTVYTSQPVDFAIAATSGNLDIDLPESETAGIAYKFSFLSADTITTFELFAIVPIISPVQFASFLPTGITNRNLDDGALRVARLLATDATLSQLVKQPAVFSAQIDGETTEQKFYLGKPFAGSIITKSLTMFGISGYENWDFNVAVINSAGTEVSIASVTSETDTANGRRRFYQEYDVSSANTVMGLVMIATPLSGSASLTATLSIAYAEIGD